MGENGRAIEVLNNALRRAKLAKGISLRDFLTEFSADV